MAISKEEKEYFKNCLEQIKTMEHFKLIVYELYTKHSYTYNNITTILRHVFEDVNINQIVKILKEFDVKRCNNGEDCKSPIGHIQPLSNFYNSKNMPDGKISMCSDCQKYNLYIKKASKIKRNYMIAFQKIKNVNKQDEFLVDLYNKGFNFKDLKFISLRGSKNINLILEKYDIKQCSQKENCKSPNGYIQSRSNFHNNSILIDGKNFKCIHCQNYEINFRNANQSKKNHMNNFQTIKELNDQDEFLVDLYNKGFCFKDLTTISLRSSNDIQLLLEKYDIRRCGKCRKVQSRTNFTKNTSALDGLANMCKTCKHEYNLDNCSKYSNSVGNYNTYAHQIGKIETVRQDPDNEKQIQVKCKTCKEWFNPTNSQLQSRIGAINGRYLIGAENHFYCSEECKYLCPLYKTRVSTLITQQRLKNNDLKEEDFERMQSELRAYFLKIRNPTKCELCGKETEQKYLILHHKIPVSIDYMIEADDYNMIFICSVCNKQAHQKDGCKTGQLAQISMENKLC